MSSQTLFVKAGATSQTCDVSLVQNAAATSPGDAKTALAYTDITGYYRVGATGTLTAITPATQTVGGAYSSGGFVKLSDSNAPGGYRFDIPDAAIPATIGGESNIWLAATGTATHQIKIIGSAHANVAAFDGVALTGGTGPIPELGIADRGTAQSASSTGLRMRSAAAFADDTCIGMTVAAYGSTQGYWQFRQVTDNTGSTDDLVVDAWGVTPSGTITYVLFGTAPFSSSVTLGVDVLKIDGSTTAAQNLKKGWNGTGGVVISANLDGSITGAVASVTSPVTVGANNDKTGYGITSVNGVEVAGSGTEVDPWGPA